MKKKLVWKVVQFKNKLFLVFLHFKSSSLTTYIQAYDTDLKTNLTFEKKIILKAVHNLVVDLILYSSSSTSSLYSIDVDGKILTVV